MRILVTGRAGFIGARIVNTYIKAGHRAAVIIYNLSTVSTQSISAYVPSKVRKIASGYGRARRILGWRPRTNFRTDIERYIRTA